MTKVFNILCQSRIFDVNDFRLTDANAPDVVASITFILILFIGITFLIYWLATTSFGKTALANSPLRRNAMPFYTPLISIAVLLLAGYISAKMLHYANKSPDELEQNFMDLGCVGIMAMAILAITPFIVIKYFVRGFKGFGLDPRTIGRDLVGAAAKLIAVWPLVLGMMLLTICIGKLIIGPNFDLQKHEELEILTKYPQWWVKLVIVVFAVIVAPLWEETFFRGHLQTGLRNFTPGPWAAIIFTSMFFIIMHIANPEHWPALFVLSMGLGYAYEKSGSLFQSIFMHAMFNGTMIAATLLQP